VGAIEEGFVEVDGVRTFFRRTQGPGTPVVFVHGNPSHSEDWVAFMEKLERPALALDLPGFGRSERPGHGYAMNDLASFYGRFLERMEIERHRLCVHDWGSLALIAEQRRPELLERLVVINAVPLFPGYRWHWVARLWRTRGVGELVNLTWNRRGFATGMRLAKGDRGRWPAQFIDSMYDRYDSGTKRAVLELYRSADYPALAAAGTDLGRLDCGALVVWGAKDPYLGMKQGAGFAERLPGAELVEVAGGGHWPWLDDAAAFERIVGFLGAGP
jgi:pimeloyl-ACP methyl ester carboxylesterase